MQEVTPPARGHAGRRRCPAGKPRLPPATEPRARAVRELLGCVHLPVAHGRHLLAVHARPRHRRPRLHLADLASRSPGMLLVALVFGELASHYPIAGALYQYSKYTVGRRYGWFVGWFYGIALLVTVAVGGHRRGRLRRRAMQQLVPLEPQPDRPRDHPGRHAGPARHPDHAEHHRRQDHGPGRAVRRLRRDPRHVRHRDRARPSTASTTARLPVHHAGRRSTSRPTRSASTSAALDSAPR